MKSFRFRTLTILAIIACFAIAAPSANAKGKKTSTVKNSKKLETEKPQAKKKPSVQPRNVIFILSDDHRYDFLGFMPEAPEWLETPALDRLAGEGAHLKNAFVSTSLCSPSRASVLTGQYMHRHRVVDNQRPVPEGTRFFPEYLQEAGYRTGFVGKWHMGHDDDSPRPGFDHWASFKGQGTYFNPTLNINGERQTFEGYNADVLADRAIEFLDETTDSEDAKPFFLYLSFKAVHFPFQPAPRNHGKYQECKVPLPETMAYTERNLESQPHWVRERRFGIHGIDHMQTRPFDNDPLPKFDDFYRRYAETVTSLDENVGRVLDWLDENELSNETMVVYMGDNGFHLGEHGFYDKRDAYETSMRVPMLAWAPGLIEPRTQVKQMVQNIDIAPTVLELAGAKQADNHVIDGQSFLPLLTGKNTAWRDHIIYEYYWEWNFPACPTLFAIRTDRYKYVYHVGVWDKNCLFDLKTDPVERHNLINVPKYRKKVRELEKQLFDELEASGGLMIPVKPPKGDPQYYDRNLRD